MMQTNFNDAIQKRRTIYALNSESPVSDERIAEVVGHAVREVPSAFNSQSARAVLLLEENHKKLWSIVMETLRKIVPPENFVQTEEKINAFAAGHGTVLYFDETAITEALMQQFPLYSDNFPVWAQHSNGMLQFAVWTALGLEGLGASLQHYNPLIDEAVREQWNLPKSWKLIAQMPFGTPTAAPGEKEFAPLEQRFLVIK